MSTNRHLLLCNGATASPSHTRRGGGRDAEASREERELWTFGARNVRLTLHEVTDPLGQNLPDVVVDLIELAALVYAADQWCPRVPEAKRFDYGLHWRRDLRFEVAVRRPGFWNRKAVRDVLVDTLSFLSDDDYAFHFRQMTDPPSVQEYLDFGGAAYGDTAATGSVDRVMLMSGGLDSLAGAAEEVLRHRRRVLMVGHKPIAYVGTRQRRLVEAIGARAADRRLAPAHIPVTANLIGVAEPDPTQRSRSFLYAALGAAVAHSSGLDGVTFYENGIVSINLPLCGQEVGGRATRTTHPQSLHGFEKIFSLVFDRPFAVTNEYLWETKQDVLAKLQGLAQSALARDSVSCIHTRFAAGKRPHCGMCSQCLSRRIAALGAAYGVDDPADGYRHDVLTAPRTRDDERVLAERFIGQARGVARMRAVREFTQAYPELNRVYPYLNLPTDVAADKLFDLHYRHATQVSGVVVGQVREHIADQWNGRLELDPDCTLAYVFTAAAAKEADAATAPGGGGDRAAGVRPDGVYPPRTIVYRGREHTCDLTDAEAAFLDRALKGGEVDVHELMRPVDGLAFKERYVANQAKRNRISQFLSRLQTRLLAARPPLGVGLSLPRGKDYVARDDPTEPPEPTSVDDSWMTRE